jgi:hypothetical protein
MPEDGTTIEVTKIEEQDAAGNWNDVTAAFRIGDNKTQKVTLTKNNGEIPLTGRKIRVLWKTNKTITDNPQVTSTYK